MMLSKAMRGLLCAVALCAALSSSSIVGAAGVEVTILNHADRPVFGAQTSIDGARLWKELGLKPRTPLQAKDDMGRTVPVQLVNGNVVFFVSAGAHERLDLKVTEAPEWSRWGATHWATWDAAASGGTLTNGALAISIAKGMTNILRGDLETGEKIIGDLRFQGYLDVEDRGLLSETDAMKHEVVRLDSRSASVLHARASLQDGSPTVTLEKRFTEGAARDLHLHESLMLHAAQPVLEYRLLFENAGERPLYLAQVGTTENCVAGSFEGVLAGPKLHVYPHPHPSYPNGSSGMIEGQRVMTWKPKWSPKYQSFESVESGFGLGAAALFHDLAYSVSVRWNSNERNFTMAVATEESTMPLPIPPGETIEVGAIFMLTPPGTDAFSETTHAYERVVRRKMTPEIPSRLAVFVDGEAVAAAPVSIMEAAPEVIASWPNSDFDVTAWSEGIRLQRVGEKAALRAAARMDLRRLPRLKLDLDTLSSGSQLRVIYRPLGEAGAEIVLAELGESGVHRVPFPVSSGNERNYPDTDFQSFELAVMLDGPHGAEAVLAGFDLRYAPEPAPEIISPRQDMSLTDFATQFVWNQSDGIFDYEFQMARDADFQNAVGFTTKESGKAQGFELSFTGEMECSLVPLELPEPGTWHWRVRALTTNIGPGDWSATRRVTINDDHTRRTPARHISPERPLFSFEIFRLHDSRRTGPRQLEKFADSIPGDLRPYTSFNINPMTYEDVEIAKEHDLFITLRRTSDLPRVEWAFQQGENVLGFVVGEHMWGFMKSEEDYRAFKRSVMLCAKYGRYFIWGDGGGMQHRWPQFASDPEMAPFVREYSDYIILGPKTNINKAAWVSHSATQGMWLDGMIGNLMMWPEAWYWDHAGFREIGTFHGDRGGKNEMMPPNFWGVQWLLGLAQGATVFTIEGQGNSTLTSLEGEVYPEHYTAIWDIDGNMTPVYWNFVEPLQRAILEQRLVPGKDQVFANIKAAVTIPDEPGYFRHGGQYGPFLPLYENTYGLREHGEVYELIPNTGRYYFIPILPMGSKPREDWKTVPISIATEEGKGPDAVDVKALFDPLYPPFYEGEAFLAHVGETVVVLNSHENKDVAESFRVEFPDRFVRSLQGRVEPHAYLTGRHRSGGFWMQCNVQYRERTISLTLECASEPHVNVEPVAALTSAEWDEASGRLHVVLAPSNCPGAIEIDVSSDEHP